MSTDKICPHPIWGPANGYDKRKNVGVCLKCGTLRAPINATGKVPTVINPESPGFSVKSKVPANEIDTTGNSVASVPKISPTTNLEEDSPYISADTNIGITAKHYDGPQTISGTGMPGPVSTFTLPANHEAEELANLAYIARINVPGEWVDPITGNRLYNKASVDAAEQAGYERGFKEGQLANMKWADRQAYFSGDIAPLRKEFTRRIKHFETLVNALQPGEKHGS